MAYEQKPNTFSLFRDSDEKVEKRKDFYREKGWKLDGVPIYSGTLLLEDGTRMNIEARVVDGAKGKFFAGRVWPYKEKSRDEPKRESARNDDPFGDDIPF